MKITKLRTNHLENPLGYYLGQPELSWIVSEAKGKTCTGVRIQVSQDQAFEKVIWATAAAWKKADTTGFSASGSCGGRRKVLLAGGSLGRRGRSRDQRDRLF